MSDFWKLSYSGPMSRCAEWADEMDLEQIVCPLVPGHQRGGRRIGDLSVLLPPIVDDIVWTGISECLIQEHVLALFRDQNLSGFEAKPVKAAWKRDRGKPLPTLWEHVVTGWAGMASPESGIRLLEHCPACKHTVFSTYSDASKLIDESRWDGSDFFMVWPLPNYRFITDRTANIIRKAKFAGVQLTRVADLTSPADSIVPIRTLTPGRLNDSMPEPRASALAEELRGLG